MTMMTWGIRDTEGNTAWAKEMAWDLSGMEYDNESTRQTWVIVAMKCQE